MMSYAPGANTDGTVSGHSLMAFVYSNVTGMWRNWQTRRSQKPVMVTSWRFQSSHPHHDLWASPDLSGLALSAVSARSAKAHNVPYCARPAPVPPAPAKDFRQSLIY